MYPDGELKQLAIHKLALRQRIHTHRADCAEAAVGAVRPLAWLDRALQAWRRITPFAKIAAVPLALVFKRKLFRRTKILGSLLRWGPIAFKILKSLKASRAAAKRPPDPIQFRRFQAFR